MNKFFEEPKRKWKEYPSDLSEETIKESVFASHKYPLFNIDNDIYYNVMRFTKVSMCIVCMQKVYEYSYSINNLDDLANFPVCKKHDNFLNKNIFPIIWQSLEAELITGTEVLNRERTMYLLRNNHVLTSRLKKLLKHEVASFGYCDFEYTLYLLKKTNLEGILK